ncbi:hypothetical protein [Shinella granuli]|uniref:Uncharacterized protein n=1 Tax=Shinella granuli TaxID=323621 RepID=A0A4R2D6R4_SHIGR|nr:hypothetical protein [Shinella granuli]TCN48882.1 hypothetical protein EV665_101621 [Shinella granuli]
MKIELKDFKTNGRTMGYVAHFDVLLDDIVLVRDLTLQRPDKFPNEAWLLLPSLARDDRRTAWFAHDLRTEIGQRAATAFGAVSGISLEYTAPRPRRHEDPPIEDTKKPAVANWLERVTAVKAERDDAGLHRVLAA